MASPHICGLLAYFLSLQPSIDSMYNIGSHGLSPKKMKANLISIATKGALTEIPAGTENILAWNGGGKTNYSEIIDEGDYEVERTDKVVNYLPEVAEHGVEYLKEKAAELKEELRKMTEELEKFVEA